VPRNDLLRNPNCVLVEAEHGGHCDFWSKVPDGSLFEYKRVSLIIPYV